MVILKDFYFGKGADFYKKNSSKKKLAFATKKISRISQYPN
jgi:hypothetical protein